MALLFRSTVDSAARWRAQLTRLTSELEVRVWPELGDSAEIDYALVWRPEPGFLASLPNLKLILSLGAGVDHLLDDPQLPRHLPIVRLVDPHMTAAMSEYVVLQVLRLHRRDLDYRTQQDAGIWRELDQQNAVERRVGILGLGELGQDVAKKLTALGFDVAGWSRSEKTLAGIRSYAGPAGLQLLLGRSEILVCLLPLTAETEGILNASTLALLPKGAALVDGARGSFRPNCQKERDKNSTVNKHSKPSRIDDFIWLIYVLGRFVDDFDGPTITSHLNVNHKNYGRGVKNASYLSGARCGH